MSLREAAQALLDRWDSQQDMDTKAGEALFEALRDALAEADPLEAEIMRTWFVLKDAGHHPGRTDDTLSECVKRAIEARAEAEKAEPVAWTPVTTRLPPYGEGKKVVCYTEGHDYAGTQFITLRASDFYEYDPDESDEPGTPEAKTVSHWIYEDDLIAAARGKG